MRITAIISVILLSTNAIENHAETNQTDIIQNMLSAIDKINTATYDLNDCYYFAAEDSLPIKISNERYIECFEKKDSSKLKIAKHVSLNHNGKSGSAYTNDSVFYVNHGHYTKDKIGGFYGVKAINPAFFSEVKILGEYLLNHLHDLNVTCNDYGEYWTIDADTTCNEQLLIRSECLYAPSNPYTKSAYSIRVDKDTYLPTSLYCLMGNPSVKNILTCNNLKFTSDSTLELSPYLGKLITDKELNDLYYKLHMEAYERVTTQPLREDTLQQSDGGYFSLAQTKGKISFLYFTSTICGIANFGNKVINRLYEDYSPEDVVVQGILTESIDPRAAEAYRQRSDIKFPLAINRNGYHEYFIGSELTPAAVIIDRNGHAKKVYFGMDYVTNTTEPKYRNTIDELLNETQKQSTRFQYD